MRKIIKKIETQRGFVALMSAIIISAILLLIATSLSLTSFYNRSNILDFELKEKSSALAEACADTAILRLATDSSYPYPNNDSVNVDGNYCIIKSVSGTPKVISVRADYKNYITKLEIEVDPNISVTRWEEK